LKRFREYVLPVQVFSHTRNPNVITRGANTAAETPNENEEELDMIKSSSREEKRLEFIQLKQSCGMSERLKKTMLLGSPQQK
jgi:hypothetical protein